MIPPPDDDSSTIPTALLAAYEHLWREVGREPIDRTRAETRAAYDEVRRIRNRMRYGSRKGARR